MTPWHTYGYSYCARGVAKCPQKQLVGKKRLLHGKQNNRQRLPAQVRKRQGNRTKKNGLHEFLGRSILTRFLRYKLFKKKQLCLYLQKLGAKEPFNCR